MVKKESHFFAHTVYKEIYCIKKETNGTEIII